MGVIGGCEFVREDQKLGSNVTLGADKSLLTRQNLHLLLFSV